MAKKVKIRVIASRIRELKPIKERTESHLEDDVEDEHTDFSVSSDAETPSLKTDFDVLARPLPSREEETARTQSFRQTDSSSRPATYTPRREGDMQVAYQDPMVAAAQRSNRPRPTASLPENSSTRILHQKAEEFAPASQLREAPFMDDRRYYTSSGEQQPKKKRYAWET
ncbi:MAG TPA: hypothetical protein VJK07_00240 [Candidatus Nanoarchaeia archaeon]|nr:hypothetical protein [Candidatus Nanoarchaeia archaeon]